MTREEIMQLIPHRDPMMLVDEAELIDDKRARGSYTVKGDEFFLQGHFPGRPIVPGVILCEIMAQAACVLLAGHINGKLTLYTSIRNARFKNQVKPGDKIELELELARIAPPFYFVKGSGSVGGEVCITSEFSVALVDPE